MINRQRILQTAKQLQRAKVRYLLGAKAIPPGIPRVLDCSGFVRYCYAAAGANVPDGTYYQWHGSIPINKEDLQIGDIGLMQDPSRPGINHIGIYAGNGYWIHCNYSRNGITLERTSIFKYSRRFKGVNFETEEEEVVKQTKMELNGQIVTVNAINKDGHNYVKLQDLKLVMDVDYDPARNLPILKSKGGK